MIRFLVTLLLAASIGVASAHAHLAASTPAADSMIAADQRGGALLHFWRDPLLLVAGSVVDPGPATCWFRMTAPLVDDEAVSPLSTALVAADFGNGISNVVSIERHLYINPDLTVYLHRPPEGDWIANDAITWLHPGAGAMAEAALWDAGGQVGRATQSLYVASR